MSCPNASNVNVVSMPPPSGPVIAEVAVATEGNQTYAEGDDVALSVDLEGNLRIRPGMRAASGVLAATNDRVTIDTRGMASVGMILSAPGTNAGTVTCVFFGELSGALVEAEIPGKRITPTPQEDPSNVTVSANEGYYFIFDVVGFDSFFIKDVFHSNPGDTVSVELRATASESELTPFRPSPTSSGFIFGFLPTFAPAQVPADGAPNYRPFVMVPGGYDAVDPNLNKTSTYAVQAGHNGVTLEVLRTAKIFNSVQATANGNTALWTPAGGKKFRLLRYMVSVTADASTMGGGVVTVSLNDAGAGIAQDHDVFLPAAAGVGGPSLYVSPWIELGNGILSAAVNNVLNANLSAALATGNVRVICCGTEE